MQTKEVSLLWTIASKCLKTSLLSLKSLNVIKDFKRDYKRRYVRKLTNSANT